MITKLRRCEINIIRQDLRDWYNRPLGQCLLAQEREQMERVLANLFGYHILQVGCLLGDDLLASSRIPHKVLLDPDSNSRTLVPGAYVYPDSLPVATDSVDVVVLPHTLEFERNPHQILREADRVLIAEGHVVVMGFNPWSLWGVASLLRGRKRKAPWCANFLSQNRVKDWVELLGFEVVRAERFFFRPPLQHRGIMGRCTVMERLGAKLWPRMSGVYILVAKKRVTTLTPIKGRWQKARAGVGGLVQPTTRGGAVSSHSKREVK